MTYQVAIRHTKEGDKGKQAKARQKKEKELGGFWVLG